MRSFPFLRTAVFAVLMVVAVSCTTTQGLSDEYYDTERADRGFYSADPYLGQRVIVVERDPFTGRYYQVSPGGLYSPVDSYYGTRSYPYGNRSYRRGSGYYRQPVPRGGHTTPAPRKTENQDKARKNVLGRN
ncbi:MAG TPA: hypothetical protein VHK69_14240 [Chitinophagaceae bacterium]|nr:hypothetical protein [Chitinophagaceae bacterium]